MFSLRSMLTVTALSATLVLSGCSGSDEGDSPDAAPSEGSSSAASEAPKMFERTCDVTVEVSGAATASWSGEGRSSNESGSTMYTFANDEGQITVYAGNDDIPMSAVLSVEKANYGTANVPDASLDVQEDGSSAVVDAATTGVEGAGPQLSASFTCEEAGKKKAGKNK